MKVGTDRSGRWSVFETVVSPGFDVGAHLHRDTEEVFYILDGELDLLAFEPRSRASRDWATWESADGARAVRGGPGSLMFVPPRCPHAFANRGVVPARMLFVAGPAGHEDYLAELGALIGRDGPPDQDAIAALRARWDIEQLTPMHPGPRLAASLPWSAGDRHEFRRRTGECPPGRPDGAQRPPQLDPGDRDGEPRPAVPARDPHRKHVRAPASRSRAGCK
jgi:mannose-6-phosphate isomerase-like protein (cupin superfamily)